MDATQSLEPVRVGPKFRVRPFQWFAAVACTILSAMTLTAMYAWVSGAVPTPPILATGAGAVHLMMLFFALVLTVVQLVLPKGTGLHMLFGMLWAAALVIGAAVSFFMHQINGGLSVPHYFSITTLIVVPLVSVLGYTRRRIAHRVLVMTFVIGVLVVAGGFAFKGLERALPQLMQAYGA